MRGRSWVVAVSAAMVSVLGAGLAPAVAADEGTSITASRSSVIAGEKFAIAGSLPSSSPQTLSLQRLDGAVWTTLIRKRTAGAYSFSTSTPASASYRVARTSSTPATTDTVDVKVATQRTKIVAPTSVTVDSLAEFTGTSSPARAGRLVSLQASTGGAWKVVDTARADATGRAFLSWRPERAGEVKVRTVASRYNGSASSTSGTRTMTVDELADGEGLPKGSGAKRDGQWITVRGEIPDGTVLSAEHSGYIFDGALVMESSTLTIPAGVRVKCPVSDGFRSCLIVAGRLDVIGTADAPVVFARSDDDAIGGRAPGPWTGTDSHAIYATSGAQVNVKHAVFHKQTTSIEARDQLGFSVRVQDTVFDGDGEDDCILFGYGASATFSRTELTGSISFGDVMDLTVEDSRLLKGSIRAHGAASLTVTGTQFSSSGQISVQGHPRSPTQLSISRSSFPGEQTADSHISLENVDADLRRNWWGAPTGPGFDVAASVDPWCADAACTTFADADGPVE